MPKLRIISGKKLVKIFKSFGFEVVKQRGSHIKMTRFLDGSFQTLIIPNHISIAKGTLKEIFEQALEFIPEKELKSLFY